MTNAGAFKKGEKKPNQGKRGPGRVTKELKEMVLEALSGVGGVQYLMDRAESHPGPFLSLLGRVLPMQVAGDPANPLRATVTLEVVGIDPPKS
jgi:hypothetical protein